MTVVVYSYVAGGVVVGVVVGVAVGVVIDVGSDVGFGVGFGVVAGAVVAAVDGGEAMITVEDSYELEGEEVPTVDAALDVGCVEKGDEIS